ncbi:hypothetical protein UFOVP100_28 [uncultured Caudovirales phage]|uniref:Uncharacterized protein n=1 Tax=uncultured Caudovirales phage TaxID=2100421 RepID=A0A6J5L3R0_9CAUD|nr:hypothetical protein UFOVP100_28 [uncultured Caudovirales phage]
MNNRYKDKKIVSLHDHKAMMALMKILYGDDNAKEGNKDSNTDGESGAQGISNLVKLPPDIA